MRRGPHFTPPQGCKRFGPFEWGEHTTRWGDFQSAWARPCPADEGSSLVVFRRDLDRLRKVRFSAAAVCYWKLAVPSARCPANFFRGVTLFAPNSRLRE